MTDHKVGVLGATSLVGAYLLPQLLAAGWRVEAFSHHVDTTRLPLLTGVTWHVLPVTDPAKVMVSDCADWISLAPIWVLPQHFPWLTAVGARRMVVLSSTSRWVKTTSSDPAERALADQLIAGEQAFITWAEQDGRAGIILRPTLIHGAGRDHNIASIARFIRRFGFFPLLGTGCGQRQPIHAREVATACQQVLVATQVAGGAYEISGGETLTYQAMVQRVFASLGRRPRLLRVPLWGFRLAVMAMRWMPPFRRLSVAMAERMNQDLVFDHGAARRDWGFAPGPFQPDADGDIH